MVATMTHLFSDCKPRGSESSCENMKCALASADKQTVAAQAKEGLQRLAT
jgi:hypothetical protein